MTLDCMNLADIDQMAPEQPVQDSAAPTETTAAMICGMCRFRPDGGVGECKNPTCIDPETNRLRYVNNKDAACDQYLSEQVYLKFKNFETDMEPLVRVPDGFRHSKEHNTICSVTWVIDRENPEGAKKPIYHPLARPIFYIIAILENPDTLEVFFKIKINQKEVIIHANELSNRKGIIALTGYGLNAVEANAGALCKYISELRAINRIPETFVYDRFGWKPDGGFVLGLKKYTPEGTEIDIDLSPMSKSKETDAVHEKGTVAGWIEAVSLIILFDPQRFKIYCALVPPILAVIEEANFSTADIGDTSVGKTVTCNTAMSIYGKPNDLNCPQTPQRQQ